MNIVLRKDRLLIKKPLIDYQKLKVYNEVNTENISFPLIVSIPHAGRVFPEEFFQMTNLSLEELRSNEDLFVDELISPLKNNGLTVLSANISRAFIDLNRDKIELDEKMFDDYPADKMIFENNRCRFGLGLIHRITSQGKPIYKSPLLFDEVQDRIKNVYNVYHLRIKQLIEDCVQKFGICFLLDCHSMPSKICSIMNDDMKIDICLGDLFSQSCPQKMTDFIMDNLSKKNYDVVKNIPYSGAYTTFNYCRPRENIYTLQLEINRSLYTREKLLLKNDNFQKLQADISGCLLDFAKFLLKN